MKISFRTVQLPKTGSVVIGIADAHALPAVIQTIDKTSGKTISRAIATKKFKATEGEFLVIPTPAHTSLDSIILMGCKTEGAFSALKMQNLGGQLLAKLKNEKISEAIVVLEYVTKEKHKSAIVAANIAYGALLRAYRFDKYKTKAKEKENNLVKNLAIQLAASKEAETLFHKLESVAKGIYFARDLVSEPPNVLYPESYAERCRKELTSLGITVNVLNIAQMKKLNMGALLGVGQGSERESRLVVMEYYGLGKNSKKAPLAFVGKGVTFDTGGISIKPSAGMEDMKYDMGGSAAVVGTMATLAGRKAKVNAVGVIGLVENMPGGNAQRPSDIVTSMSGQTIEVLNTDAEGRLVLADALWYCHTNFKPKFMIDLATLTGAIVVALGSEYAGLFSNNQELAERLMKVGTETGEKLWQFPMGKEYDKQMDSKIADMQNIGMGKGAGSITAAQFLQRFVKEVPWAHLDIAGTAWTKKELDTCPEGATGFGIQLLNALVEKYYEA